MILTTIASDNWMEGCYFKYDPLPKLGKLEEISAVLELHLQMAKRPLSILGS